MNASMEPSSSPQTSNLHPSPQQQQHQQSKPQTNQPQTQQSQLQPKLSPQPQPHQNQQPSKDPITCHVLDLTTGLPAASMGVTLEPMMPPPYSKSDTKSTFRGEHCLTAKTNADGRIMQWNPEGSASVEGLLSKMKAERSVWRLRFNTGEYFGEGKGFFPEVVVSFFVDVREGGHVHVPLLIGPYSYTTYRGS